MLVNTSIVLSKKNLQGLELMSDERQRINRRSVLRLAASSAAWLMLCDRATAANWPSKPIRVIVPLGAGSTIDIVGRIVLEAMSKQLGQTIVIENRGGAGGTIGSAAVARSEPDGYTLLVNSSQHTVVPAAYPNLGYDTARDFVSLAVLGTAPNVLVVSSGSKFKSVNDMVASAKAQPGSITYSTTGVGSGVHLATELFRSSAGFEGVHIPFRGMQEAITEVLAGQVDFCCATAAAALPFIRDGQLKALAVMTPSRSRSLPDVPTSIEAGSRKSSYTFWIGLFAPSKTPPDVVHRLREEAKQALGLAAVADRLSQVGVEPAGTSPQSFDEQILREIDINFRLVQKAGLKLN